MPSKKIAVALSGGIDSSVAAYLLKKQGHDIIGLTMRLWPYTKGNLGGGSNWNFPETDYSPAEKVCDWLRIPFHVIDLSTQFMRYIIQPFCNEYERGCTPNPCVRCNPIIKFGFLLDEALKSGAAYLATGHYAGIFHNADGYHLIRAEDTRKDQSYMLYALDQSQLSHTVFPLNSLTRERVSEIAREAKMPSADRESSQDACFVGGDYRKFIEGHVVFKPGPMVNSRGQIIGTHRGLPFYTIGQRHGLGIALGQPAFVIDLNYAKNQVVVGTAEELNCSELMVCDLSWISGRVPLETDGITAKIRYRSAEVRATIIIEESRARVILAQSLRAAVPGQSIVFYKGKEILGGGTIDEKL